MWRFIGRSWLVCIHHLSHKSHSRSVVFVLPSRPSSHKKMWASWSLWDAGGVHPLLQPLPVVRTLYQLCWLMYQTNIPQQIPILRITVVVASPPKRKYRWPFDEGNFFCNMRTFLLDSLLLDLFFFLHKLWWKKTLLFIFTCFFTDALSMVLEFLDHVNVLESGGFVWLNLWKCHRLIQKSTRGWV